MKKIIKNFPHKIGIHCASACVRDLLDFYDIHLTEEMCFGLGCGLNFLYAKSVKDNYYYILGRGDHIELNAGRHLGLKVGNWRFYDREEAWIWLKKQLDFNVPMIVNAEATKLKYLCDRFNLLENVRYGGHKIVVVGYDPDKSEIYLYDYAWYEMLTISIENLKEARDSDPRVILRNVMFNFIKPDQLIPIERAIPAAIRKNVHNMLYPWVGHSGVRGLKRFVRDITGWHKNMEDEVLKKDCYMAYMMLEAGGTGGGNFRRIYSRFLFEVADILKDNRYSEAAKKYSWIAKRWSEIAKMILDGQNGVGHGIFAGREKIQPILDELYSKELEAIRYLGEITGYQN